MRLRVRSHPRASTQRGRRSGDRRVAGVAIRWALAWGLVLASPTLAQPRETATLESLMGALRASAGIRAHYTEVRHEPILAEPLESSGMLYFSPPDRLARYTERPETSVIVVHGGEAALVRGDRVRRFDLRSSDVATHLLDNLLVLLRGDLDLLRERNEITFASDEAGWSLRLEPRLKAVRSVPDSTEFLGRGDAVWRMETRETNGGTTVTLFDDVETGVVFAPEGIARIFSLDRPEAPR